MRVLAAAVGAGWAVLATCQLAAQTGRPAYPDSVRADSTAPGAAPARGGALVYRGRARQLAVRIPRLDAAIEVDGSLADPVWQRAAQLTDFSEYTPVDGPPAEDSTQVFVWYSPHAIYFGIRAYEPHGSVHATLADRDKIDADDNVQLIITPFVHGRQALVFAVNPLGVQEDGTITEGTLVQQQFGIAGHAGRPPTDLSPDFVYESKGHLTAAGYEVVVRIPFRSIKYQSKDPQDWGLNIVRKVQHSGHEDTWAPTALSASSFLGQSGTLVGLTGLDRGLVLDLNPFVTQRATGSPALAAGPGWHYGVERPQLGSNARWGITNNLTLNGTYRPDFAEVESDATQVQYDPRNAIYYAEKRPFFLDGLEQFNTPNNLIYTRQITAPIAAAKLTGKISDVTVAYMSAQDDEGSPVLGGGGHPLFNILRLQRDVGEASQIGVVATDKEDGGTFNRLAGLDARVTFGKIYSLAVQGAGSTTRRVFPGGLGLGVATAAGPLWQGRFIRTGRTVGIDYSVSGIDPEFVAGSGFISRTGVAGMNLDHTVTLYGRPTAFLETFTGDFGIIHTWMYRHFTAGEAPEDRRYHFTGTATMRGGWQLGGAIYFETYGYDPALYAGYFLGHIAAHDTTYTPYVGQAIIPNTDYVISLSTPQFAHFSGSILYISGRDENFFEWSSADIGNSQLTLGWRPTDKLRLNATYIANLYHRHSDGSLVERQLIPRLDAEYQLSRPIFFRIIGQYVATHQDSLRDDSRTNLPIFFRDPISGIFTRATAFTTNQLQLSALFAYQPLPGTVAFVGYGNNMTEPASFHFITLRRTADSFFVKFSYLFRM
jgi:uncharacterized protein DUF5916